MKRKTYVIKNKVTGKYYARDSRAFAPKWTNNILNAETYSQSWVNDTVKDIRAGEKMLGRNDKFVQVTAKEVK